MGPQGAAASHRNQQLKAGKMSKTPSIAAIAVLTVLAVLVCFPAPSAWGYIDIAYSLGRIIHESRFIMVLRVQQVDRQKNLIVFSKVRDIKGKHPGDTVKHNIGNFGLDPQESKDIMAWAGVGKTGVFFHNGSGGMLYFDKYWYQVAMGDWCRLIHSEPLFYPAFFGKSTKLEAALDAMLAGQEVVVPCMVLGDFKTLFERTGRIQRLKASMKLLTYDAKRDFVGWGAEEFQRIRDMPGYTHYAALSPMGSGTHGIVPADFDGDGNLDLCLFGEKRVVLLQNGGGSLSEVGLPVQVGARAAGWADFNGDKKPDLLLATPFGPKLLRNKGKEFEDLSNRLPQSDYHNVTAAAWIDYDGDKRPDILLSDGFLGLRLYRNLEPGAVKTAKPKIGEWHYAGPFDNPGGRGFDTVYPPENGVDLSKEYVGKNGEKVVWRKGNFPDGKVNNLAIFKPAGNQNSVAYVYRELDFGGSAEVPVSLGSDDTLTVWLNGRKLVAQNAARGCAPDQAVLTLKLRPGKNRLLLKICQGGGGFAFYYAAKNPEEVPPPMFEDVSDKVGLGARGAGGRLKGDHLAVADVDGDGRDDFLYSAGTGLLVMNTEAGFVAAERAGIEYRAGGIVPAFGDFNGDGRIDLFVPQRKGNSKLFSNNGAARFSDVTSKSGALSEPIRHAVCAVWGDFAGRGYPDLLVGCVRGQNRYFRNNGDGSFFDAGVDFGWYKRIFNTCGLATLDVDGNGTLDVVLANEGRESAVLLGRAMSSR